uniref:Uncharacterized protein n=1 Tax=Nelumbo nucifera TaxID=4432 RepID=A0A822XKE7_NELNU|nr:TPA_asm: hypothetical protein HUJ06_022230 [Nelumbo nucifera]
MIISQLLSAFRAFSIHLMGKDGRHHNEESDGYPQIKH